ncbi:MAG: S8 family serine peptidase, partial [Myxococcota bacterium]
ANLQAMQQRSAGFEAVRRLRREAGADVARVVRAAGGAVREHFTLAGAMLVKVPAEQLQRLAALPQVRHLEAEEAGELPPDSVADGRDRISSDPYFNGGATGSGFIALLDSGVRTSHTLFTSPDHIWITEDCVYGDAFCSDTGDWRYNPDDDCWDHGTSTAAIITGNGDLGDASRGVTGGWLDSWKVYGRSCGGLNTTAVLRAYDEAVRWGDQIIVAEMQSGQSDSGSIASAADSAFDSGSITIAANGNNGPNSGTVNSPAIAHKALGIGAYDVDSLAHQSYQSEGPTPDNRYKPEVQAPTNADTASTASSTTINNFGGTSGATPFAAGAASVFADWFNMTARTAANGGKIYASLINGGTRAWGQFNNVQGVGPFELPLGGTFYTGSRNVSHHENEVISFNVPAGTTQVRATLWWAEDQGASHGDVDLYIRDHYNITRDSSTSGPSVFEHAIANNPSYTGTWDLRVYGYNIPSTVTVYYAVHVVN